MRRLVLLLLGIAAAYGFIAFVAPALTRLPGAREVIRAADDAGIDATALWYTESAATDRAEARTRDGIAHPPR